jgi:hypothetical protein
MQQAIAWGDYWFTVTLSCSIAFFVQPITTGTIDYRKSC